MTSPIEKVTVQFHNNEMSLPIFSDEETKFGIINLVMKDMPVNKTPIFIFFSNDISGSMSDVCKNGRNTKMDHSIHTIRNILNLLSKYSEEVEIWVQLDGFDDEIIGVIPPTQVTKDNLSELHNLVGKMFPRNGTNIELAIQNANRKMTEFKSTHTSVDMVHIFTTDGNANAGNTNTEVLSSLVNEKYANIFIGFGEDHSFKTLNNLASSNILGKYYFIDDIESGGLVYGEIIHSILYKILENTIIEVDDGKIYNYLTNKWESTIMLGSLYSGAKKTYHLSSAYPQQCRVTISGFMFNFVDAKEVAVLSEMTDLKKYIFRQKVQELMFQHLKGNSVKSEIKDIFDKLLKYMEEEPEDILLKNLHDDLMSIISSNHSSNIYCQARAHSNGRETTYAPSFGRNIDRGRPVRFFDNSEDNIAFGMMRGVSDNCRREYSNPTQYDCMRSCSQPMEEEEIDQTSVFGFGCPAPSRTSSSYRAYAAPRNCYTTGYLPMEEQEEDDIPMVGMTRQSSV
jgi:hypothetical protein